MCFVSASQTSLEVHDCCGKWRIETSVWNLILDLYLWFSYNSIVQCQILQQISKGSKVQMDTSCILQMLSHLALSWYGFQTTFNFNYYFYQYFLKQTVNIHHDYSFQSRYISLWTTCLCPNYVIILLHYSGQQQPKIISPCKIRLK